LIKEGICKRGKREEFIFSKEDLEIKIPIDDITETAKWT
jgi:hypothetical protein